MVVFLLLKSTEFGLNISKITHQGRFFSRESSKEPSPGFVYRKNQLFLPPKPSADAQKDRDTYRAPVRVTCSLSGRIRKAEPVFILILTYLKIFPPQIFRLSFQE